MAGSIKRGMNVLIGLSIVLAFLFHSSCDPNPDCFSPNKGSFNLKFFDTLSSAPIDTNFFSIVSLADSDILLYDNDGINRTSFELLIDPAADSSTFVFTTLIFSELRRDTLRVSYRRRQRIISLACDLEQFYDQLAISKTTYDTLSLVSAKLDITNETNIAVVDLSRSN